MRAEEELRKTNERLDQAMKKWVEGIYVGIINVAYFDGLTPESWWKGGIGIATLELKDGTFTCEYSDGIPGGGFGDYSVKSNTITFNNNNAWIANFDWGLILSGEYEYTFDGEKLVFAKGVDKYAYYQYNFEKR